MYWYLAFFSLFISIGMGSLIESYNLLLACIVLLYIFILFYSYCIAPGLFALALPYNFPQLTAIISVAYLETGAYSSELDQYTYFTGATERLVLLNIFFIFGVIGYKIVLMPKTKYLNGVKYCLNTIKTLNIVLYSCLLYSLLFIICGIIWGFPLSMDQQRFFYWSEHPYGWFLSKLLSVGPYSGVFFGYYLYCNAGSRKTKRIWYSILILSAVAIIYGNKFGWFLDLILNMCIGYTFAIGVNNKKLVSLSLKKGIYVILFLCFLIVNIFYSYLFIHGYHFDDVSSLVASRILELQGQVWWAVDNILIQGTHEINFSNLIVPKSESLPGGIFILMEVIAPYKTFLSYFNQGVPFTMGYPAILYYSLGYALASILQIILGVIWIDLYVNISWCIRNEKIYQASALLLLTLLFSWAFSLGSTYVLAGPLGIILFLYYLFTTFRLHKIDFF